MIATVLGILLSGAPHARAQSITGALEGTVVSSTGAAPLSGVDVSIRSAALQGVRRLASDERGRFTFPALPSGTYVVEFRSIGFTPVRITDVAVPLGTTASVGAVRLITSTQLDVVVISGARPILDPTTAASATVIESAHFRALPTGRDFHSLLSIAPQGNPSPYGDGVSFGGATGYDNAYFIDGIHANEPVYSNGGMKVPYNFVKEVQIITGGYEPEYGRSQGAVVNVVTNEGSNELRGQAVAFFTGNGLRASPRWGIAQRPVDRYRHYDVGVSLGGPVQRDQLWFYGAYNPLVEDKDVAFNGIMSQRDRLVRHLFAGKLTWRPASGSDVSLTVLGDPTTRDAVEGVEAKSAPLSTVTDARAVLGTYRDGGWATTLRLRQQSGHRVLWNVAASHLTNVHQVAQRSGADDPVSLARVDDLVKDETSGNFGRSYRLNTSRTSADANVTLLGSTHTAKLGMVYERNAVHAPFERTSYVTHFPDGSWGLEDQTKGPGRGHSTVPAVYVQDSWEISPHVRLNAGIRWEGQYIGGPTIGRVMTIADEWAPRVGLIWQPGSSGTHKVSASAGRFFEQLPLWSVVLLTMPLTSVFGSYPQNPLANRTGGSEFVQNLTPAPIEFVDPQLCGQHYDELTLGYERRIGAAHRFGARGVVRALRAGIEQAFAIPNPMGPDSSILGNPGMGALSYLPSATRRYSGLELTFERSGTGRLRYLASYVLGRAYGNQPGEFNADDRYPATHVTAARAFPVWWEHATGYLPSDRRHLAKLSGSYRVGDNITIGTATWVASGLPLSEFAHDPWPFYYTPVTKRGTNGRTPGTWTADLRFGYDLRAGGRSSPTQVVVDVFNVGNQRRAVDFDQLHYGDPARSNANPNYMKVNQYQAPLSARVGIVVGF